MLKRIGKSIRANILMGLFLAIPVVTTFLILNLLINISTNWLLDSSLLVSHSHGWRGPLLRFMLIVVLIVLLYLVGLLARNLLGRRLYRAADKLLVSIPFLRNIYISVRHISASLFTQRKTLFKEVVLVEYPRKGLYSMAFTTAQVPSAIGQQVRDERSRPQLSLFIPTTPNPTSGVLILAPRDAVIPLAIPVSDALTFIMSGGAVSPGEETDSGFALLDRLETWLQAHNREVSEDEHATPSTP